MKRREFLIAIPGAVVAASTIAPALAALEPARSEVFLGIDFANESGDWTSITCLRRYPDRTAELLRWKSFPALTPDHHERVCRTVRECIEKWEPKGFAIAHGAPPDLMRALQARGLVRDFLG